MKVLINFFKWSLPTPQLNFIYIWCKNQSY